MFDDLCFTDCCCRFSVVLALGLLYCLLFFLPVLILFFSVLAKRLSGKSVSDI